MAFSVTTLPLYGQGGSYSAQMDRLFVKAAANTGGTRKLTAASGGAATGDLAVTTSATPASVTIAAGEVMLQGLTSAGFYFAVNDGPITLGTVAANSSGSTRYDLIVVRVSDTGAAPTITTAIVTGTPGGAVPTPTVTSTTIETPLASITVPNGFTTGTVIAAGNITDARRKAFLPDLSVQGTTTATIPSPTNGNLVYDDTLKQWKFYDGTAWKMMQATAFLCTNATRPTGSQLFDGLQIYETDTKRTYEYNGTAFVAMDTPLVCTSATRPTTGLYDGMIIYETDTNETLVAYNTATTPVWRRPWRMPWGVVGQANVTTSQSGINAVVDLTGLSITWTAVANRRYKATFTGTFTTVAGAVGDTYLLTYTDATPTTIQQRSLVFPTTAFQHNGTQLTTVETGLAAGSVTRKLRYQRFSGTGTGTLTGSSTETAQFIIEDIGPNGAPA